jgi:hypothetical protein
MNDLNLYFVIYSVFCDPNDWYGHSAYVFAKDMNAAQNYIIKSYKQNVNIRSIEQINVSEGTILKRGR